MLRSMKELQGYIIRALDGDIGKVHDFFFGDFEWTVRYLVADTGTWLVGQRVLLSPSALGDPDWEAHSLPVHLTKNQVEKSPPISMDKPVSRQMEHDLHAYYGWRPYWSGSAPMLSGQELEAVKEKRGAAEADPHLRSTREVTGYQIQASDGDIGHVADFIVDDDLWVIRYLVIDTRNWLPGKKVLVSPAWVESVDWPERKLQIDLKRETIKACPEFDPSAPINREYEIRLYDFYGRPKYWT